MKSTLLVFLVLIFAPAAGRTAELDDAAVKKLSRAYTTAWNAQNAAGVAALYAADAVLTLSDGRTLRGRDEIQKTLGAEMSGKGTLTLQADESRALGSAAGVWRCDWKRTEPKGGSPRGTRLAVLTASGDGWMIAEDLVALSPAAPKKAAPAHGHEHGPGGHSH